MGRPLHSRGLSPDIGTGGRHLGTPARAKLGQFSRRAGASCGSTLGSAAFAARTTGGGTCHATWSSVRFPRGLEIPVSDKGGRGSARCCRPQRRPRRDLDAFVRQLRSHQDVLCVRRPDPETIRKAAERTVCRSTASRASACSIRTSTTSRSVEGVRTPMNIKYGFSVAMATLALLAVRSGRGRGQHLDQRARRDRGVQRSGFSASRWLRPADRRRGSGVHRAAGAGSMGVHYVKGALVRGTIDAARPQAVVYEVQADGRLQLVALEYVVLQAAWDAAHGAPASCSAKSSCSPGRQPLRAASVLRAACLDLEAQSEGHVQPVEPAGRLRRGGR